MSRFHIDPEHEQAVLDALDDLHAAEDALTDAKTKQKLAKLTLEDAISDAGLERALVINGKVISARSKPTAEEGPLFAGTRALSRADER